jgi:hypothetical protein
LKYSKLQIPKFKEASVSRSPHGGVATDSD